jgi:diacylglycerol O-acyltransferase
VGRAAAARRRPARSPPPPRLALIDGLPGGRQALLTTTHHAIADGLASVELTRAIFDHPVHAGASRPPNGNSFLGPAGRTGGLVPALQAAAGAARYLAGGPIAAPGPFNGTVGPRRALAMVNLRLADVVAVKRQLGGTVDDIVLAVVALALGTYLRRRGLATDRPMRAMVPVSTLAGGGRMGNHVTATFLDLPMDLPPARCLRGIAAAKYLHRAWHEPLGLRAALEVAGHAPLALTSPLTQFLCALPFANLIVSDVPGPQEPLSLLGAPMIGASPLMPLTASVGLSIAVVTVGGSMGVGITTDPDLVGDGDELARDVDAGFRALQDAAWPGRARGRSGDVRDQRRVGAAG